MIYIKGENIDLIENDQEIIERRENIPTRFRKKKFRPSKIRKHEFDWQRNELNQWRGPGTDTDYQVGYPSVGDGIEEAWNAESSGEVNLVSGKDRIVFRKHSQGEPQVSDTGQLYFDEESIGKIPSNIDQRTQHMTDLGLDPADVYNAIQKKYISDNSQESLDYIAELKSKGVVFKSFEDRVQEGIEIAVDKSNYFTELLENIGLDEEKYREMIDAYAANNEYYLFSEMSPDRSEDDWASGRFTGFIEMDWDYLSDDSFLKYLNDDQSIIECVMGANTTVKIPSDAVDLEDYGFDNLKSYERDIEVEVNLDLLKEAILEENPLVTLNDSDDLEIKIPIQELKDTKIFSEYDTQVSYVAVDKEYFVTEENLKKAYYEDRENFSTALGKSGVDKEKKLELLDDHDLPYKIKGKIESFKDMFHSIWADCYFETPFGKERVGMSWHVHDDVQARNIKTYDDFLKDAVLKYFGRFGKEDEEILRRFEKIAKRKKTRKVQDKVILRKYDELSESQENQETQDANDEFRMLQIRV